MWHQSAIVDLYFVKSEYHSLEVVDRVSKTQLQVGENSELMVAQLFTLVTAAVSRWRADWLHFEHHISAAGSE